MSALDELIKVRGRQDPDPGELFISGKDPVLDSRFKLGEVAAAPGLPRMVPARLQVASDQRTHRRAHQDHCAG